MIRVRLSIFILICTMHSIVSKANCFENREQLNQITSSLGGRSNLPLGLRDLHEKGKVFYSTLDGIAAVPIREHAAIFFIGNNLRLVNPQGTHRIMSSSQVTRVCLSDIGFTVQINSPHCNLLNRDDCIQNCLDVRSNSLRICYDNCGFSIFESQCQKDCKRTSGNLQSQCEVRKRNCEHESRDCYIPFGSRQASAGVHEITIHGRRFITNSQTRVLDEHIRSLGPPVTTPWRTDMLVFPKGR